MDETLNRLVHCAHVADWEARVAEVDGSADDAVDKARVVRDEQYREVVRYCQGLPAVDRQASNTVTLDWDDAAQLLHLAELNACHISTLRKRVRDALLRDNRQGGEVK